MATQKALRALLEGILRLPERVLRVIAGRPRFGDLGAALDLEVHVLLRLNERMGPPPPHRLGAFAARDANERGATIVRASPESLHRVVDRQLEGPAGPISIRVYSPRASDAPLPIVVYYHGGCWIFGSLESHDAACRALAKRSDAIVVSVAYRLAPEAPYPGPLDDAEAAFRWVVAHGSELGGDEARIAVAGDSAGGNLAAAVCLRQKRARGPLPHAQILIYPALDLTRSLPSHGLFAEGYFLDEGTMDWAIRTYLPSPADARRPEVSPIFADDLHGLPPAVIITAGFDPLRDEGRLYAEQLERAGVPVRHRCETALIHGYLSMDLLSSCAAARDRLCDDVRAAVHATISSTRTGVALNDANAR